MPVHSHSKTLQRQMLNRAFAPAQQRAIEYNLIPEPAAVISTAAQTYNANATLAASTELFWSQIDPGWYLLRGGLALAIANAAHNIKFDFAGGTITASNVVGRSTFNITAASGKETALTALNTASDGSTSTAWTSCDIWLTFQTVTPGSFAMQFAQSASGASNSVVSAGSYLELIRLREPRPA